MTEMQKQFEEWRLSIVANSNLKKNGEIYFDNDVHCDWQAWQASRAAIVVKLPEPKSSVEAVFSMKVTKSLDDIGVYYE